MTCRCVSLLTVLMVHHQTITFVLQPDDFTNCCGDFNYSRQIMLAHLGQYFIHASLVGVPTACGRRTGVPMGCLVSSQVQHPAALQSFDADIGIEGVIPVGRLLARCEARVRHR